MHSPTCIRAANPNSDSDFQGLCDVLIDCVEGGASVSFMLPIMRETAENFWRNALLSSARQERVVLVAEDRYGIVGTAQVIWAQPENQPHRGDLAKMLVHRRARRQGIGASLLSEAERIAAKSGKTLLVLDTVTDTDAFRLYQRHGWLRCGEIPNYALWPDGRSCPTTVFYKLLQA